MGLIRSSCCLSAQAVPATSLYGEVTPKGITTVLATLEGSVWEGEIWGALRAQASCLWPPTAAQGTVGLGVLQHGAGLVRWWASAGVDPGPSEALPRILLLSLGLSPLLL